jgi:hypothetical protein
MKRHPMNVTRSALLLAAALFAFACGRNETVASKSAAAYREAQAKGVPVTGGHEHGGHDAATSSVATETMDHSAHETGTDPHAGHDMTAGGTAGHDAHGSMSAGDHAKMDHATMDHATMDHATMDHAAMDHSAMDHAAHGSMPAADHAAMGHAAHSEGAAMTNHAQHESTAGAAHDSHAGMQHDMPATSMDSHAQHQHQQPAAGAPRVALDAPTTSAAIARTQPAATLRADDFDAPAPSALEEAKKATAGKKEK